MFFWWFSLPFSKKQGKEGQGKTLVLGRVGHSRCEGDAERKCGNYCLRWLAVDIFQVVSNVSLVGETGCGRRAQACSDSHAGKKQFAEKTAVKNAGGSGRRKWATELFVRSRPGKPNQRNGQNEKFMNFAHFCEFWCFSLGKQARFTLNFCSGMPLRKVHELTFLWFGLPGPLLIWGGCNIMSLVTVTIERSAERSASESASPTRVAEDSKCQKVLGGPRLCRK